MGPKARFNVTMVAIVQSTDLTALREWKQDAGHHVQKSDLHRYTKTRRAVTMPNLDPTPHAFHVPLNHQVHDGGPSRASSRNLWAALLGFVLGTALQLQQAALWDGATYLALVLLSFGVFSVAALVNSRLGLRAALALAALALLAFGLTGLRSLHFLEASLNPALEGRDVVVTGVVCEMPQRNDSGVRFRLNLESAIFEDAPVVLPPRLDVSWYGTSYASHGDTANELVAAAAGAPGDLQAGERWRMTVRLKAPHGARNPLGFDYELWLWEQGVQATGYVRTSTRDQVPSRLGQTGMHPIAWARQQVREQILRRISPKPVAGLIAALVVGDQNAIDQGDWDVFRATGVAHLVSISGLHITMFAWAASLLVGRLWRYSTRLCMRMPAPTAGLIGGVILAVMYALFSGWGIPAQRTCLMLLCVAVLRLCGLRWPWPVVWMLACAVVVACDPWALTQAGFWLSFVAVGVLFCTDAPHKNEDALTREPGGTLLSHRFKGLKAKTWTALRSGLREQSVITLALAPLTLLFFGQVSVVGLVANAFAIPWVTLVVMPLSMLGTVLPVAWDLAAVSVVVLMAWLQWLASFSWATVALPVAPAWAGAAGMVGALLLVGRLPWHLRGLGVPMLLPVLFWTPTLPEAGHFELLAADIGQGNAVLVRTAQHALLYDAGPRYSLESDAGHRVLVPLLQATQTHLDSVVLSHRDADHVGGAEAVLVMQPHATLLSSIEDDHRLQALRHAQRCEAGQHWQWDGVQFDVLHPQAADYSSPAKSNAMSCVLRISNGKHTALLVGDIESPQEARLVASGAAIKADVLLVPHHGSKTSSSDAFLDAVAPSFALVQAGYRNRFGHPVQAVMQRYIDRSILVRDSPHCGAMTWNSQRPGSLDCLRDTSSRYWGHHVP
jgi:competence protein ComEC